MMRRPPSHTRTDTPCPSTTLFRSDRLIKTVRHHHPKADVALIERAYTAAETAHSGQRRKSGEPYITHPIAVAQVLADLGIGRSEEHTSELQSLMRNSYALFCLN